MTPLDLAMKAGRELDALVAEKVMGWKRGRRYGNGNGEWITPNQVGAFPTTWDRTPDFSTDIAAAWEVVAALTAGKFYVCVEHVHQRGHSWHAWVGDRNTSAATAPLAICLAALKSVGSP